MKLRFLSLLTVGAALAGCEASVFLDETEETAPVEVPTDPTEPIDPTDPPPSPAAFCTSTPFSGDEDDAVAVLTSPDNVEILLRDGTKRTLDVPVDVVPSDDATVFNYVAVGGDRIVVTHVENGWLNDELTQSVRVRWFTRAGDLLEEELADHQYTAVAVSSAHVTVLAESEPFGSWVVLRAADGTKTVVEGFDVYSPVLEGRYVAGYDHAALTYGFLDLETGERWLNGAGAATAILTDEGFAYLVPGDDTFTLVREGPTSVVETVLTAPLPDSIWIESAANGSALLVSYDEGPPDAWHVDLASGTVTEVPNEGPEGEALLDYNCGIGPVALREDGAILRAFRANGDAFVGAFEAGSTSFDRIGPTLGAPFEFSMSEQAGTTLISVSDEQETFCPINDWTEAPSEDSVQGRALALVRGDIVHVIEGAVYWDWQVTLTSEGTCALAYDYAGSTRVIDVISGEETELGSTTATFFE